MHQISIDCMEMDSEYLAGAGLVITNRVPIHIFINVQIHTIFYTICFSQALLCFGMFLSTTPCTCCSFQLPLTYFSVPISTFTYSKPEKDNTWIRQIQLSTDFKEIHYFLFFSETWFKQFGTYTKKVSYKYYHQFKRKIGYFKTSECSHCKV